ncbi:MAG: hypothetical protein SVY53_03210 [Chloroflexota bacterium]|nr:hypothetical protein [Chloroflexota bacterium]
MTTQTAPTEQPAANVQGSTSNAHSVARKALDEAHGTTPQQEPEPQPAITETPEATPTEQEPAKGEDNAAKIKELEQRLSTQGGLLRQAQEENKQLKASTSGQEELRDHIAALQESMVSLKTAQLESMVAGGHEEQANAIAARDVSQMLTDAKLSLDDPRLAGLRRVQAEGMPAVKQMAYLQDLLVAIRPEAPKTIETPAAPAEDPPSLPKTQEEINTLLEAAREDERKRMNMTRKEDGTYAVLAGVPSGKSKPSTPNQVARAALDEARGR